MLILIATGLWSQETRWSEVLLSNTANFKPNIVGEDETSVYSVSVIDDMYYIQRFNKVTLSQDYKISIDKIRLGTNFMTYEGIYFVDGSFLVFTSLYLDNRDIYNIFVYQYDAETGNKTIERKNILSIDAPSFRKKGSFNVFVSDDKTKVLINYTNYLKSEKSLKEVFVLYDNKLNVITEKEETIPGDELNYRAFNFHIDNDGSFYHLKKTSNGISSLVSYNANMDFEKWESIIDLRELDKNIQVYQSKFILNSKNDLLLVGFYSRDQETLDGTFMMKINTESKEITSLKANLFTDETKVFLANSSASFRNEKSILPLTTYNVLDAYIKEDGGYIITGENIFAIEGRVTTEDVIILNHSSNGDLLWSKRIAKRQAGTINNLKYLSFFAAIQNNSFSVYTYELRDNYNSDTHCYHRSISYATTMTDMQSLAFTEYKFNLKTGECVKDEIMTPKKATFIVTASCYQSRYNRDIFFFSKKGKKFQIGIKPPLQSSAL